MKIKNTMVAALVAAVGCGAFAADVGAKVNGTASRPLRRRLSRLKTARSR